MSRGIWTNDELLEYRDETEELVGGFTCTIYRDPPHGSEDGPTALFENVPCFYLPQRTREVFEAGNTRLVKTPAQLWLAYDDAAGITENDFVSRIVDQLGTPRITRAHNIQGIDFHDSHIVVELAGVRS